MTDISLLFAGGIGVVVAIVHGVLLQRRFIIPLLSTARVNSDIASMFPMIMHFSTVSWFMTGVALIAAPWCFGSNLRFFIACLAVGLYGFAAAGNLVVMRGRDVGWIPLVLCSALSAYGAV